jgi:hypothetical protein
MRNMALAGALVLLLAGTAFGAPYLVSDPQEGVVGYEIKGLGNTVTYIAQADGSLKYDLATLPAGDYAATIAACNIWGCGDSVPDAAPK